MYAIIEIKAKQYKVSVGDTIYTDLLNENSDQTEVEIQEVLFVQDDHSTQVGTPYVEGAKVICFIEKEVKGKKVIAFKYRHTKNSKSIKGHRQRYHKLTIKSIAV